jgi:hypothetical protein
MKVQLFAALMFLSFAATAAQAAPEMKDGLWEISTTMEMPGLPFQPPPTTMTHCYGKEDVKDQKQFVPSQGEDCKVSDLKTTGNKVSYTVICTGQNAVKGEGEITLKGDSAYEGFMKMTMEGMNMTTRYSAKRVGPCE